MGTKSGARKLATLIGIAALIFLICHSLLPKLAESPCLEVVQSNLHSGVDATAYFYTELDDFLQYERAVVEGASRTHSSADGGAEPAPKDAR